MFFTLRDGILTRTTVTGATGGMGLQVVKAILQSGADVIAIDRGDTPNNPLWGNVLNSRVAGYEELMSWIAKDVKRTTEKNGTTLDYRKCDVSDLESTYAVFESAVSSARHPLRGLVNCAGIGWVGPSISFPVDEAKRIIDVNLIGTLICAQAAARLVQKYNFSASFVFIASMSGYIVNKVSISLQRNRLVATAVDLG
jgi:NAD(P)-dependent dehydrogenase (short-subunit alcohol dehydrogenase family)